MSVTRIQLRRGTASQWASSSDVILAAGEIGFETDTNNFKIGNGEDTWDELSYFKNVDELNSLTDNNLSNYARTSQLSNYLLANKLGVSDGVASLDSQGRVPIDQLANIIDGAPEALNTLNELAAALNDNPDVIEDILSALDGKVSDTGDTIKGDLVVQNSDSPGTGVGRVTANTLRLLSTGEADLTSTGHALQIGADNTTKLKIDQNEIQAVDSANAANTLALQPHGGSVTFGAGISVNGNIDLTGTGRSISTGTAGNSGSISVGSGGITTTGKISSIQPIQDKASSYTLVASDKFTLIRSTATGGITISVPATALVKGERIDFVQWTTGGQITFQQGTGTPTIKSHANKFKSNGESAAVSLVKLNDSPHEYLLIGNLVA